MSGRLLKARVLEQMRLDSVLAAGTFEGEAKNPPQLYAVVFVNSGRRSQGRFTGPSSQITQTYTIHSVGLIPEQSQFLADKVQMQLVDFRPQLEGWNCRRLTHEVSLPTQIDRDVSPPLYYCVDEFDLVAERI